MTVDDMNPAAVPELRSEISKGWTWIEWLLLLLILAGAVFVRFAYADRDLSYDELWHLGLSTGRGSPLGQIAHDVVFDHPPLQTSLAGAPAAWHVWTGMDGVLHPPLYVLALRLWRDVFGQSDVEARGLSVAWSCVAIIAQYGMMRDATNRRLAILVAFAMASAQAQVYFGQQVRGYAMLVAIASVGLWMMTRIEVLGETKRRAVLLGLVPFAMLLTHYFGAGAAMAIAVFGIWRMRGRCRRTFIAMLVGTAIVYCMVWVPFALQQLDDLSTGDGFLRSARTGPLRELLLLLSAPIRLVVDRVYTEAPFNLLSGLAMILPWPLVRRFPALRPWALWLCLSFVPLAVLDLTRSTEHMMFVRYLAAASPAVVPIFVGCAWAIDRRIAYAIGGSLGFMGLIFTLSHAPVSAGSPGYAASSYYIAQHIQPGDGLIVANGSLPDWIADVFALQISHENGLFPRPFVILSAPITPAIIDKMPRQAWVMLGDDDYPIERLIPGATVTAHRYADMTIGLYHVTLPATDQPRVPMTAPSTATAPSAGTSAP